MCTTTKSIGELGATPPGRYAAEPPKRALRATYGPFRGPPRVTLNRGSLPRNYLQSIAA